MSEPVAVVIWKRHPIGGRLSHMGELGKVY